jgi:hypothetical protein
MTTAAADRRIAGLNAGHFCDHGGLEVDACLSASTLGLWLQVVMQHDETLDSGLVERCRFALIALVARR